LALDASGAPARAVQNRHEQHFIALQLNQAWVTDTTYTVGKIEDVGIQSKQEVSLAGSEGDVN